MEIVNEIRLEIQKLSQKSTPLVRKIASQFKKQISKLDIDAIYQICETLLKTKVWAETIIAYQIISDCKNKYVESTYDQFEDWTFRYVEDWWDCDDFMTHAFQQLLQKYPHQIERTHRWIHHEKFAVRRCAAVVLIRLQAVGFVDTSSIFSLVDLLLEDEHYLVQKGFGWLLKETSVKKPNEVIQYLENNYKKMSRTAFRYAIEKLPLSDKHRLMQLS